MSKKVLKVELSFYSIFYEVQILIRALYAIFVRRRIMYLRTYQNFQSANHKKDWIHKSQIHRVSHLRKFRISNKLFMSANLRNLFADPPTKRPPAGPQL
jgi:hypothetical protein